MKTSKSVWYVLLVAVVVSTSFVVPAAVVAQEAAAVHIVFVSDRARLTAGQCAMLEWHVEGGFEVQLNGQRVPHQGAKQVCPQKTKVFTLGVDMGDRVEVRELAIVVEGSGQPPQAPPQKPAPQPSPGQPGVTISFRADKTNLKAGECTTLRWDVEHAKEVYLNGNGVVGHSSKQVCPPATKTHVLHVLHSAGATDEKVTLQVAGSGAPAPPQPGNPQPGKRSADLAVTDLYPDKLPKGSVWVRVTNNGPATLKNTPIEMKCNAAGNPLGNTKPWSHVEAPWLQTISLSPGQTATFKTRMTVDTSKYAYNIACVVSPPSKGATFADPNGSNNKYSEAIAQKTKAPAPFRANVAVTDLFAKRLRGGKLFARITNHGPGTLKNVTVHLRCQGAGWKGGKATSINGGGPRVLNLSPGQTAVVDTGILINIDKYNYYEMTCRVQASFAANNSYSERIP
jgi:hypothetical protein